jgi:hypothetical protein
MIFNTDGFTAPAHGDQYPDGTGLLGHVHSLFAACIPTQHGNPARRQCCRRLGTVLTALVMVLAIMTFSAPDLWAVKSSHSGKYQAFRGARAIDGDTFYYRGKRYRIQQYNAPELNEPGGRQAKKILQQKINSGDYAWKPVARDKYGRTIVREKKR